MPAALCEIGELVMSSSGLGSGQSPLGGSRHRSRPARPVFAPPPVEVAPDNAPQQINQSPDAVDLDVCPWLYLNVEPDTRGASVTDDHRCELLPDVVPGPGHQVAYCLTPNHRGCPQLRGYEAQRRTAALGAAQQAEIVPFPAPMQPQSPPIATSTPGRGISQWLWISLAAVGALLLGAVLALYALPGHTVDAPIEEATPVAASQQVSPPVPRVSQPLAVPATEVPSLAGGVPTWNSPADDAAATTNSTTPTNPDAQLPKAYVVEFGDTLSSIARRFDVSIDALISANDLANGSLLVSVGDKLVIPSP